MEFSLYLSKYANELVWLLTESSSVSGTGEVKPLFKSSSVMISVVKKKPVPTANGNIPGKSEEKKQEEQTVNRTSTGLHSLCQNYESDDD